MIKKFINRRTILICSLALHVLVTLPLLAFVIMDGAIQQQIYLHLAARFGKYDIALIGDSITAGGYVWATKIGVYNFNVWNYGAGGFTTEQVQSYAERAAENHFRFCSVMAGTNDGLNNDEAVSKSFGDYQKLLKMLTDAGVQPIVTLVLYRQNEKFRTFRDAYNNLLRGYCVLKGITVIDLNPLLCDATGLKREYTVDGTHLTPAAYRDWGKEINRVLHEKKYL